MPLSRNKIRKIVLLEVRKQAREKYIVKRIKLIRENLLLEGYDKQKVDRLLIESILLKEYIPILGSAIKGLSGIVGSGTGDFFGLFGSGEDEDGEGQSAIRTYVEQTALQFIVKTLGLDPYSWWGITLKNILETSMRELSEDEFWDMLSGDKSVCEPSSEKFAEIVIKSLEESLKEKLLNTIMDSIFKEMGPAFREHPVGKGIYLPMREKLSASFSDVMKSQKLKVEFLNIICDYLDYDVIWGKAKEIASNAMTDTWDNFTDAISDFIPGSGDEENEEES